MRVACLLSESALFDLFVKLSQFFFGEAVGVALLERDGRWSAHDDEKALQALCHLSEHRCVILMFDAYVPRDR